MAQGKYTKEDGVKARGGMGHNNPPKKVNKGVASGQIRSIVNRIENLDDERVAIAGDIREIYAEAKSNGYNTKVLRTLIQRRKRDKAELEEMEATLDLYEHAMEDD